MSVTPSVHVTPTRINSEIPTSPEARAAAEWLSAHEEAVAKMRPAWADPARTIAALDFDGEAESVWFVRQFETVEVIQGARVQGGDIELDRPAHIRNVSMPSVEELSMLEVGELGSDMIRAAQYLAACEGTSTDDSELRVSDVFRLRQMGVAVGEQLRRRTGVDDKLRGLDD